MNLMELHCHLSSAWPREFLFSVQGDATFCRICWSPFSSCALPGRVAKSAFPDIFWKPTNFSRFVQTNTYSCTKSSSTWHLKALEPELNRLEKALEDEAQRNETALNQAGLQRHLIHVWYRFSTWQSRNSTQKLTAIKVWSHFNSTLLRQKKLKTWCLLRCVIWKHLLEKSKESWRRTNPQNKQMSSMAYGHVPIMLRRAAQFETQKADVFWTQEVALSGDCITFPTTWRWTYWGKNQSGARRGWAFCLPCRDKPLKYQLHVSRQRAKKSKNKRNRWQSDWENVLHRSNSSLPVWELSFAPSEQLSTIHISHMPPVTIGAEMLKQHNCVIGFWLSSSPW